jgi:putative membrane-bound dehydrogenase-like protein
MTVSPRWPIAAFAGFLAANLAGTSAGQGQPTPQPTLPLRRTSADEDYGAKLPRFPMKDPVESLRAIVPRPGFRVELVAAEPLLRSPVAIDFDEDGRLYIAEYPEYNQHDKGAKKDPRLAHERGCIRMLEDADGDGAYEKSTLFAPDVPMATAVACWDGGVYVGSPPDLLYLKDTDGDGKADMRRVIYTGFGLDPAGEGMLNSFRWGMDNRFHISTGLDGGSVRRADRAGARTVSVRGYGFLVDPRGETFELTGGGGQHGMTLDDWGRTYVCGNSDPFHLVMYDSRYVARNPYLRAPAAAVNIAPAGKFTKLYRLSPVEPWRALRTRMRTQGLFAGSDEGGTPSGFFTGATGVTVYRGDAYPPEFRGNLFVGEVSNNLIHRAIAEPRGLLLTARDAEPPGREFLASRDCYFRPAQMANAPDGCLWVLDMCRELIETTISMPPEIVKHMDISSGVDRGRIWRIAPEGHKPRVTRLGKATTADLVALLEHPNGWHRDTASRLLYQRQDRSAVPALRRVAAGSKWPIGRAHALSTLAGLGALEPGDVLAALDDPEPRLRAHALRLAEPFCRADERIARRMADMAGDADPTVRYQLAFSLGALPGKQAAAALAALPVRDAADSWMRMAVLSSAMNCAGEVFTRLAADAGFRASAHGRAFLTALVGQTGVAERPDDLAAVLASLDGPLAGEPALARGVVLALMDDDSPAARARLVGARGGRVRSILDGLLADARTTAVGDDKPLAARTAAVRALRFAELPDVEGPLTELLAPRQPAAVQAEAVSTLARFDGARVPAILLRGWPGMSPKLRATAAEALFSRPAWVNAFLDAIASGTIARADLDPARLALLKSYPDAAVRDRAGRLLTAAQARRQDVVAAYQQALRLKGDPGRGKEVFKAQCSTCHRLEGVGQQVGADLSAIRDRGLDAVLLNILDPNREVMPQFLSYVLVTTAGRVLTGMIAVETANSLTIRQPDGHEETVLRIHIDELRSTGLSYMPEGLEKQIDLPAMADLLAYLNSIK